MPSVFIIAVRPRPSPAAEVPVQYRERLRTKGAKQSTARRMLKKKQKIQICDTTGLILCVEPKTGKKCFKAVGRAEVKKTSKDLTTQKHAVQHKLGPEYY